MEDNKNNSVDTSRNDEYVEVPLGGGYKITVGSPDEKEVLDCGSLREYLDGSEEPEVLTAEYLLGTTRLGGWLKLFLFSLGVSSAIGLVEVVALCSDDWGAGARFLSVCEMAMAAMCVALSAYVIYGFIMRRPGVVTVAKIYVAFLGVASVLGLVFDLDSTADTVKSLIWAATWFTFLFLSKSVEACIPPRYRRLSAADKAMLIVAGVIAVLVVLAGCVYEPTPTKVYGESGYVDGGYEYDGYEATGYDTDAISDVARVAYVCPDGMTDDVMHTADGDGMLEIHTFDGDGAGISAVSEHVDFFTKGTFDAFVEETLPSAGDYAVTETYYGELTKPGCKVYYREYEFYDKAADLGYMWRVAIVYEKDSHTAVTVVANDTYFDTRFGKGKYMKKFIDDIKFN